MAKSTKIWDGTNWHDLQGPPGPNAVSADVGNDLTLGSDGLLFTGAAVRDTDAYVFCKSGDDIAAKYEQAKALTPNGQPLAAGNRATLIVLPAVYPVASPLLVDAEFVDIIGLCSVKLPVGCEPAVSITGDGTVEVSANDVRVKGLRAVTFSIPNALPLQRWDECSAGSFGEGYAAGSFTNCTGGDFSFCCGAVANASGTFDNCEAGDESFGGDAGSASGTFKNCTARQGCFGGYGGKASGEFYDCHGGADSFGNGMEASGTFVNCTGWNGSFGGGDAFEASGKFYNCRGGDNSFGCGAGANASGMFVNCEAGVDSFGFDGNASGTFVNCTGGTNSFGGGSNGIASGTFDNCRGGGSSFGGVGGTASGEFHDCRGGADSWAGLTASARLVGCTMQAGPFGSASIDPAAILVNCVDGDFNKVDIP